jgi:hypothetical protein
MCDCNHPEECAKPTAQTDAQGNCSEAQVEKCHGDASAQPAPDPKTAK